MGLRHHFRLTDLTAGRVRNSAGPDFLCHRARRVGNLLRDGFTGPRAGRVGNFLRDRLAGPRAGRVRNLLDDVFAGPRASRVGNLFVDRVLFVANARVRHLLYHGLRDLSAHRVRLLAVTNFLLHACAGDGPHFGSGNPMLAADRATGLFADGSAATGLVAATAVAGIPFPRTWIANTLLNDRTGNLLRFRNPVARAVRNLLRFADRLALHEHSGRSKTQGARRRCGAGVQPAR